MDTFSCPIIITGRSAITPAGTGLQPLLDAMRADRSCLKPAPVDLPGVTDGLLWGRADQFKAADFMPPLKARKLDRGSQFAVSAAGLALSDAGIARGMVAPERIGIALGCGFGGIANSAEFLTGYFQQGIAGLTPLLFPNTVANAPASNSSIEYGLKGPNITFVQRFCSAESAILAACRFIEEGRADIMLAGGVDELTPLMMEGFAALGQLRSHASGFGEGAGIVVLERGEHAARRGAVTKAHIRRISTVGMLPPGAEKQGIERLLQEDCQPDRVAVSGAVSAAGPIRAALQARSEHLPELTIGRSLAMGGTTLAVLSALLAPGEQGLHLAASPEGPYFCISITGGDPV